MKKKSFKVKLSAASVSNILSKLGYKVKAKSKSSVILSPDSKVKEINFSTPNSANRYLSKLVAKLKELGYKVINSNYSFSGEHSKVILENEKYRISFNGVKENDLYNFEGKIMLLSSDIKKVTLFSKKSNKLLIESRFRKLLNRI